MNRYRQIAGTIVLIILFIAILFQKAEARDPGINIIIPECPTFYESLAARELRRYIYLRTDQLLPIVHKNTIPMYSDAILVATKSQKIMDDFTTSSANKSVVESLGPQQFLLRLFPLTNGQKILVITGGDNAGTLYGAYRFLETIGIRFYLNGDVVPDVTIPLELPCLNETGRPLFDIRGIQPFHDFPEGPDWWSEDEYLAYISQLAKMRMNFIGFHCYPEGNVGPEPAVWIGQKSDTDNKGCVSFSYRSEWANTKRKSMWGYAPMKTGDFTCGASNLFADDTAESPVTAMSKINSNKPGKYNKIFNQSAFMFQKVFAHAHKLGIKTGIGTETPLTVPDLVKERLKKLGKDIKEPEIIRELYEGIFLRISRAYPVDYYWLWTPESWTWNGNKPEEFDSAVRDIQLALEALKAIGKPFKIATCGWVLGPEQDRSALDKVLPPDCPIGCINREVGHTPIDPAFKKINNRPKWAIPWLENDPNLVSPQLWVGRMFYDSADAYRLGCTGLLGIHWRTKIIACNIAALAESAWDLSGNSEKRSKLLPISGSDDMGNTPAKTDNKSRNRAIPVEEFYKDFASVNFGKNIAEKTAAILSKIDGTNLPEPSIWCEGPGGINIEKNKSWQEIKKQYSFVDELTLLRPEINSPGNLERFDYLLYSFRYMTEMAQAGCLRGELDSIVKKIKAEVNPSSRKKLVNEAVELRIKLARTWESMMTFQLAAVDTPGELGTIANLEQHNRLYLKFLDAHDDFLTKELGAPLPNEIALSNEYRGPIRIIVPALRSQISRGENISIKAYVLSQIPVNKLTLMLRPMGTGKFSPLPFKHIKRGLYVVTLPYENRQYDFEYYIRLSYDRGKTLHYPATAPAINQTVIVL